MPKQLTRRQMAELQKRLGILQAWRAGRLTASYVDIREAVVFITKLLANDDPESDTCKAIRTLRDDFSRIGIYINGFTLIPLKDLVDIEIVEDEPTFSIEALG